MTTGFVLGLIVLAFYGAMFWAAWELMKRPALLHRARKV